MSAEFNSNLECCPPFDPSLWEDKILVWENKKFIRDRVRTFFFMPLNFGSAMRRLDSVVRKNNAEVQDYLCMSEHTSKWNMDLYLAVDKEIAGADNHVFSGKYFCKVYEGHFKNTGKWCREYEESARARGLKTSKLYMWYTTCPKCAKKYGKNYVVILSPVE